MIWGVLLGLAFILLMFFASFKVVAKIEKEETDNPDLTKVDIKEFLADEDVRILGKEEKKND